MSHTQAAFDKILATVGRIQYKNWQLKVGLQDAVTPFLQVIFEADGETQRCRKWLLSFHMGTDEIVRTVWKAILAAEEHEAAEKFLYKGQSIFNPHFDPDALAEFAEGGNLSTRAEVSGIKTILIGDQRIRIRIDGDEVHAEKITEMV